MQLACRVTVSWAANLRQQDWRSGEIHEPQPVVLHAGGAPPFRPSVRGLKYSARPYGLSALWPLCLWNASQSFGLALLSIEPCR